MSGRIPGSGFTGAALELGRRFLLVDYNPEHLSLASNRRNQRP